MLNPSFKWGVQGGGPPLYMSKNYCQSHNDGYISHKKDQYSKQAAHSYDTKDSLDKGFADYEHDAYNFYKHHTALVLGAVAVVGFSIIYFNEELQADFDDLYDGSW